MVNEKKWKEVDPKQIKPGDRIRRVKLISPDDSEILEMTVSKTRFGLHQFWLEPGFNIFFYRKRVKTPKHVITPLDIEHE